MDAVKFLEERARMCGHGCKNCKAYEEQCDIYMEGCDYESLVKVVEAWAEEHPRKTRQSVFQAQFPNAQLDAQGILAFTPCQLNTHIICKQMACTKEKDAKDCTSCRREFWMEEVE